jgi:hypothetical protein
MSADGCDADQLPGRRFDVIVGHQFQFQIKLYPLL